MFQSINGDFCLGAYYGYAGGGVNDGGFFSIDIENSTHKHINFDEFDEMSENNSLHHSILESLMKKLWHFVDEDRWNYDSNGSWLMLRK